MKVMKKLSCLLLAMLLMFSLAATAFADDAATYSITVNDSNPNHKYVAYQIFTGDLYIDPDAGAEEIPTLSNIVWGDGVTHEDDAVAADVAAAIEDAADFADEMAGKRIEASGKVLTFDEGSGIYKVDGLKPGYYLIVDEGPADDSDPENYTYTKFVLQVVANAEATPKTGVPQLVKKVKDVNDSTGVDSGWQDSTDYDIGDEVEFQLSITLPANYSSYEKYALTVHDTMSAGLQFVEDSVEAPFSGGSYSVNTTAGGIDIVVADLKAAGTFTDGQTLVITYKAKLLDSAVIGGAGNPNEAYMEFSNNPNFKGSGDAPKGHTPTSKVTVFTFDLRVNKVEKDEDMSSDDLLVTKALKGAEFTLEKWNGSEWEQFDIVNAVGDDTVHFYFKGLDDGYYRLHESKTPAGYNTCEDKYFAVEASHDVDGAELTIKELTVGEDNSFTVGGVLDGFAADASKAGSEETPVIATDILNQRGLQLPETGGIGTTIFYVAGGVLVLLALVLLITKKRMTKASND